MGRLGGGRSVCIVEHFGYHGVEGNDIPGLWVEDGYDMGNCWVQATKGEERKLGVGQPRIDKKIRTRTDEPLSFAFKEVPST